jgi:hypothetical protein
MHRFITALTLLLGTALMSSPSLEAQKNCRKGIPCGNTCISATKVCRIGGGSATAETSVTPLAPNSEARWVASSRGQKYYLSTCSAARRLSPANRIYFKTEEDAQEAGYTKSATRGC